MCANIGIISDNYKCFAIKIRKYQYYFLHFLRKYRNVLHGKLRKYQYFIYLRTPISRRYSFRMLSYSLISSSNIAANIQLFANTKEFIKKKSYLCSDVYLNKSYGTEKSDAGADNGAW